jgi:hypothetical protein
MEKCPVFDGNIQALEPGPVSSGIGLRFEGKNIAPQIWGAR